MPADPNRSKRIYDERDEALRLAADRLQEILALRNERDRLNATLASIWLRLQNLTAEVEELLPRRGERPTENNS